jgi:Ca-activated chloride channel family protein
MHFHTPISWFLYTTVGLFLLINIIFFLRINRIAKKTRAVIRSRIYIKFAMRCIAIGCILIALLGPSFGKSKSDIIIRSKNILFLLDVSLSMNARDVSPSRLEKAHTIIHNIVNQNPTDQFGLIAFASGASIQCPLTFDNETFLVFTQTANTSLFDHSGTNTYDALRLADNYLSNYKKEGNTKPCLVILLTDGEGITEDVQTIKTEAFSTFTLVGIGTEMGSRIPYHKVYKKDKNGDDVVSMLERASLKEFASETKASYYEVSDKQNNEPGLYSSIRNYKGDTQGISKIEVAGNKFHYFLYVALGLIILDVLITVKTVEI